MLHKVNVKKFELWCAWSEHFNDSFVTKKWSESDLTFIMTLMSLILKMCVTRAERHLNIRGSQKMKVSQNDVDVIMSIGDSAALRSPQTTEKIIGGSKIIGARLMVYSVTSRWGEYSNPCCFSGKLGLEKGPFGAYHKLNTNNLLNSFQKMKKSWKSWSCKYAVWLLHPVFQEVILPC